jgi:hypothetical protein
MITIRVQVLVMSYEKGLAWVRINNVSGITLQQDLNTGGYV